MSSSARKRRIPPLRRRVPLPTAAKEPKRRFLRPLWREIPSGGQNLSGSYFFSRATGPWRGGGLGLPRPPGPPGLCHAVWLGGGPRAGGDTGPYGKAAVLGVGADTIRPPYPGQLLRLLAPGAFFRPAGLFFWIAQPAAAAGKRGQSTAPPAPDARNGPREASPVTGSGGRRLECLHSSEPVPGDLWFFPSWERTTKTTFCGFGGTGRAGETPAPTPGVRPVGGGVPTAPLRVLAEEGGCAYNILKLKIILSEIVDIEK